MDEKRHKPVMAKDRARKRERDPLFPEKPSNKNASEHNPASGIPKGVSDGNLKQLLFFQMLSVLFHELLHTTGRIDQFLLAGEKGMASGTDFHLDLRLDGTELNLVAAGTEGLNTMIFRMDTFFHGYIPPLNYQKSHSMHLLKGTNPTFTEAVHYIVKFFFCKQGSAG